MLPNRMIILLRFNASCSIFLAGELLSPKSEGISEEKEVVFVNPEEIHDVLLVELLEVEGGELFRRHGVLVSVPPRLGL